MAVLLARRGEFYEKLFEGDPTAWGILVAVVAISIGWGVLKRRMRGA